MAVSFFVTDANGFEVQIGAGAVTAIQDNGLTGCSYCIRARIRGDSDEAGQQRTSTLATVAFESADRAYSSARQPTSISYFRGGEFGLGGG